MIRLALFAETVSKEAFCVCHKTVGEPCRLVFVGGRLGWSTRPVSSKRARFQQEADVYASKLVFNPATTSHLNILDPTSTHQAPTRSSNRGDHVWLVFGFICCEKCTRSI